MAIPKINSAHGADTRNIINRVIEVLNQQGRTIQDLVAEGQLTEEQYAELIIVINGLLKSGEVNEYDLTSEVREKINAVPELENRINRLIESFDGTEELYTPIGLENYMTKQNEEWVV